MNRLILVAAATVLLALPLLLWLVGLWSGRHDRQQATEMPWQWTLRSALLYTAAFNLTFLLQELFLVLPKALTPGLRPTLFHNNHSWQGNNPIVALLQGGGVLATLSSAAICLALLKWWRHASASMRLFLLWMAYCGFFMALPQLVVGAMSAGSDVGMALTYLQWSDHRKTTMALLAIVCMPGIALYLKDALLALAPTPLQDVTTRSAYLLKIATLPMCLALPLIFVFRVPREWIEVVIVPSVVTLTGLIWMQATAWRSSRLPWCGSPLPKTLIWPLGLMALLLLLFQLVLRPGIRFY